MRDTNPYADLDLAGLYDSLQSRARELLARDSAMATDTAYLLLAVAARVAPETSLPGAAGAQVKGGADPLAAFWPLYERLAREARYRILVKAVDAMRLGPHWIRDARVGAARAYDLALGSDDGLRTVLGSLPMRQSVGSADPDAPSSST